MAGKVSNSTRNGHTKRGQVREGTGGGKVLKSRGPFLQKTDRTGSPTWDRSLWMGPFLDPLTEQTTYSPAPLDLFKFILQSPGYAQRLKKHYQFFRAAVEEESAQRNPTQQYPASARR